MANRNVLNLKAKSLGDPKMAPGDKSIPHAIDQSALMSKEDKISADSVMGMNDAMRPAEYVGVDPFGKYKDIVNVWPNDVVRLDIFNANGVYLESNYRVNSYTKSGETVELDPEKDLQDLRYQSGRYSVVYKFHRNLLGSGDGIGLQIQEVSADGLEIRVIPTVSLTDLDANVNLQEFFSNGFFQLPKPKVLPNLFLFKDANTPIRVFDYVQDKFTIQTPPYSIIFKLTSPVPTGVVVGDIMWLSQQVSDDVREPSVILSPPKPKVKKTQIAGPNWDALNKGRTATSTQYRDWDDLLSTQTQTTNDIVNSLMSRSLLEGVPLNIDYRHFDNHVHFGSATERLLNFKYKMELIESYDARIAALTTDLAGLPSSSVSSSLYFQSNVINTQTKKAALLGGFDGYEKYLYYQSSSYVTNSFGEFYPSTWPKQNNSKPYINSLVNSAEVEEWWTGIYASASLYDQNNENALYRLIPAHVLEDDSNEQYVLFTQMIGHYFDLVFGYVKNMVKIQNRDESILEGFSKDLIYHVAQNLGVDFENGSTLEELWSYALGTDVSGSVSSTYEITTEDRTKETWKRIINNLPYLLKTKGTDRGVRALINCFGIPQTILRIREYGGAEPDFDTKTDYVYERFNYSTTVGYNGKTSGQVAQLISVPFQSLSGFNNKKPLSIELRAKMAPNQTKEQKLMEVTGSWHIKAHQDNGNTYIGFYLSGSQGWATASVSSSIYDGDWHHIALLRDTESDVSSANQTYKLIVKKEKYQKVVSTVSASLFIDGSTSSSYNNAFVNGGNTLWIPGSGSFPAATSHSMALWSGSVQELRFWSSTLQDSILDNHTLAPTSFQGNLADTHTGSTSSYSELAVRFPLGADNNKWDIYATASVSSSHPNQQIHNGTATFYNFSGSYFNGVTQIHSLEWPDLGANRSISNKIRVDQTITAGGNQLYRNTSVERSLTDNYPAENPRLGVYLSPVNETNQDIAEQFGGLSIDDFIGDPGDLSKDSYSGLEQLRYEYYKKYTSGRRRAQNYIRLLDHYDASLFQLIKKFVPHRANTQVGLVIEPNLLTRNKIGIKPPTFEENHYSASLDVGPETWITPGGFVQDGDGEPFRNMAGYVQEGTIGGDESDYIAVSGEAGDVLEYTTPRQDINMLPSLDEFTYDMVVLDGITISPTGSLTDSKVSEYNNAGIDPNPSTPGSSEGDVNTGLTAYGRDRVEGSQYVFTSYYQSGSGAGLTWTPYTSSRYDYHEALNPVIMTNAKSVISNNSDSVYDRNIFNGKAFTYDPALPVTGLPDFFTLVESEGGLQDSMWTREFGLRLEDTIILDGTQYSLQEAYDDISGTGWYIGEGGYNPGETDGLYFLYNGVAATYDHYLAWQIPAFFYKADDPSTHNLRYRVKLNITSSDTGLGLLVVSLFSKLTPTALTSTLLSSVDMTGDSQYSFDFETKVTGPYLQVIMEMEQGSGNNEEYAFNNLSVECLNYRAEVQDFHLRDSYGMRNARYDGCKITSSDWNINSPDTTDGGPVVEVTVGGGKQLSVKPNTKGTFEVK